MVITCFYGMLKVTQQRDSRLLNLPIACCCWFSPVTSHGRSTADHLLVLQKACVKAPLFPVPSKALRKGSRVLPLFFLRGIQLASLRRG